MALVAALLAAAELLHKTSDKAGVGDTIGSTSQQSC
jgi:hypothetical protein